jgi:energy-coupling factor transporter ATP-binding protein EcfA2
MLIFIGPTASGKTTLMRLLCRSIRESGGKCLYITSPPFGGLAYFITLLLSTVLIYAYNPGEMLARKKRLAVLEVMNYKLLSKILPLLIISDFIFKIAQQTAFIILEKLGFIILVEDYYPQMIADHLVYYKLYGSNSKTTRSLIALEFSILYKHSTGPRNTTCIYVYAEEIALRERELRRFGGFLSVGGFYNKVVRSLLPRVICEHVGLNIKYINTTV